ncbi:MAG: dUTP diphosphatase [Acidimicrobiia bacterium]
MHVRISRLDPDVSLPVQAHSDDAGYDLCAREDVRIEAGGGRVLVPTGLAVAIPPGYAGLVLPRSGLAMKHGISLLNTPGLIDPQYRGELKVLLVNTDPNEAYDVRRGDRIAQLVIQKVEYVEWIEVEQLDETERDTFGFGSTGR